jgi:hypothetical protein
MKSMGRLFRVRNDRSVRDEIGENGLWVRGAKSLQIAGCYADSVGVAANVLDLREFIGNMQAMKVTLKLSDVPADLVKPILRLAVDLDREADEIMVACLRAALAGRKHRAVIAGHLPTRAQVTAGTARVASIAAAAAEEDWVARKRAEYIGIAGRLRSDGKTVTDAAIRAARARPDHWINTEHRTGVPDEWKAAAGVVE